MPNNGLLEGLECPKCEQHDTFYMEVTVTGRALVTDGAFTFNDPENVVADYPTTAIACAVCGHTGDADDFIVA